MRSKTAKLLKKFATTLPESELSDKVIEHKKYSVSNNFKKKPDGKVATIRKQNIKGGNFIEKETKRIWNNTPRPERFSLRKIMQAAIEKSKEILTKINKEK